MSDLRALTLPQPEAYVTRKELARLMGISTKTVDRFVREGMPSVVFGTRSRRFLASRAVAWAQNQRRRAA